MLKDLQNTVRQLATENASAILTAGGVVGVVATSFLTAQATLKATEVLKEHEASQPAMGRVELTKQAKLRMTWPLFLPPLAVGAATIASTIFANHISSKKAAALAAAYGVSERSLKEYREKALEKLGIGKEQKLRDEIAQDRVTANPPGKEVIIIADGDVLCFDTHSGRYFESKVEKIRQAEVKVNANIYHHMSDSLSSFYDEVGLKPTGYSDDIGWNAEYMCEVSFSTTMARDERPCIVIDFVNQPVPEYQRNY